MSRIRATPVVVQAGKITFLFARPATALLTMALMVKEEVHLVPPAEGRAQLEERRRVTFVKEVGARGIHVLTALNDGTGFLRSDYMVRWRRRLYG